MIKLIITSFFTLLAAFSYSQQNVFITLSPKVASADLVIGTDVTNLNGIVFNLEYFDYYLSGLHIIHDDGQDLDLSDTVFLIEPTNFVLYLGYLNVTNIEQIQFAVGVPANLNTQDGLDAIDISVYPHGHPLGFQDPSMYWGWTSGYAHMIIGGLADSNSDGIPDALFQLHNLGNSNYLPYQMPVIQTQTNLSQIDVYINCNVDTWLKDIAIQSVGVLHGSANENADVMNNVITESVFNQGANAAVSNAESGVGTMTFSSVNSSLSISWKNIKNVGSFQLNDLSGKIIKLGSVSDETGCFIFDNISNGIYNFTFFDKNLNALNSIKVAM